MCPSTMSATTGCSRQEDLSQTHSFSSEMDRYSALVSWCRESIETNRDFLYDAGPFHNALHNACSDFGYPYEVRYCWDGRFVRSFSHVLLPLGYSRSSHHHCHAPNLT
jgi:hypothetical protein